MQPFVILVVTVEFVGEMFTVGSKINSHVQYSQLDSSGQTLEFNGV